MAGIVLAILAILIAQSSAEDYDDYCYADNRLPKPDGFRAQSIEGCKPVQIWLLSRHGATYPDREFITQLPKLVSLHDEIKNKTGQFGRLCDVDLETLRDWRLNPNVTKKANRVTPQGELNMKNLALDLKWQFYWTLTPVYNILENYKVRSTNSLATWVSMKSFQEALFGRTYAVSVQLSNFMDSLFRAHKYCPAWYSSIENDRVDAEAKKFIAGSEYQNVVNNVRRRLGFNDTINDVTIGLMYDLCLYETSWSNYKLSPWCTVFSKDDFEVLEYPKDLYNYYYFGPGRDISTQLGCYSLKEMFNDFKNLEQGNNKPYGVFHFTDAITVQNLLTALGINKDLIPLRADNFQSMKNRRFRTSTLGSFESNLVAVFHKCSDPRSPYKVTFYLNQSPVQIDGCSHEFCNWDYLKDRFGKTAEECTLDFCNGTTTVNENSTTTTADYNNGTTSSEGHDNSTTTTTISSQN